MECNKKIFRGILIVVATLIPFLMSVLTLLYYGHSIEDCKPVWGDEAWWWKIAEAVAEYGRPLGYWGYNGGTPVIGTFATWGAAMVIPYGLFGAVFGWGYSSFIYANVFYMCLATLIFVLLTKAQTKDVIILSVASLCMVIRTFFSVTAMAECVRWSLGVIAVALLIYIYKNESHAIIKYILIPLYLIYITQAYLIFGLFFLFYFYIVLSKTKLKWYLSLAISACGMGIVVLLSKKFLGLFTSPYINGGSKGRLERITSNLLGIKNILQEEDSFFAVYLIIYLLIMLATLLFPLFDKKMKKWDKELHIVAFVILVAFLGGHVVFYNTTKWTFTRGLSIALMISIFMLCLSKRKQCVAIFVIGTILSFPLYSKVETTFFEEKRYVTADWEETVNKNALIFDEYLEVIENAESPWENTVSSYGMSGIPGFYYSLPKGYALQAMINESVDIQSKYALIGKVSRPDLYPQRLENLQAMGYELLYDGDEMTILVNEKYLSCENTTESTK